MDPDLAVDLGRKALFVTGLVSAPILIAGLVVGLAIGLLQALTQVQEQTVAFVPKLMAMAVALALTLPWILQQMIDYSQALIAGIPGNL
ncbi:flagellar biosynthesis protein FliQ [Botrimarina hoheduenensis]|uniref:Flagellar biosynthetic protein FliQ n=1 Tax=Botrimarina hoheduenensis TaxID=2528000 RepID=A0A5C5VX11_9BACT|nr:flagellar biosynthesis protein FliQ [Botrimarina hoheduenensis]TWT43196.1 Flagellar biosynthetic protein FliQ [Botrimarina hoheduenensis]